MSRSREFRPHNHRAGYRRGRRHRGRGYIAFILVPAVASYGRLWEKAAAGVLSLFILGTLLGIGASLGLAIVWSYDRYGT